MGLFMDMITSNNENLKSLLEFDVDDGTENDDEDTNYDSNSDEDDNNSTEDNNDTEDDDSGDESDDNTSDNSGDDGPINDEDEDTDYNVEDTEDDSGEEGTDEYNVPEESDDNSTEDNNNAEGNDSGDESDDNTSDDSGDDGPTNDEDEDTDYGDDSGDSDGETDDNDSEDSGGSVDPDRLKQIESELFENLSDSQKAIKLKELKNCFIKLYESCDSILEKLNKSTAPNEDITRIFDYVSNVLNNLKQYVYDYYTDTFDTRSYMENTAQYQKYLTILSTVRNILEEVKCKRPE